MYRQIFIKNILLIIFFFCLSRISYGQNLTPTENEQLNAFLTTQYKIYQLERESQMIQNRNIGIGFLAGTFLSQDPISKSILGGMGILYIGFGFLSTTISEDEKKFASYFQTKENPLLLLKSIQNREFSQRIWGGIWLTGGLILINYALQSLFSDGDLYSNNFSIVKNGAIYFSYASIINCFFLETRIESQANQWIKILQ